MSVIVTGTLAQTSITDVYPTHDSLIGLGGSREVGTIALRNAIPVEQRRFGMLVTVNADGTPANNKTYILANIALGGVDNVLANNTNWIDFSAGGGAGSQILFVDTTPVFAGNGGPFDFGTYVMPANTMATNGDVIEGEAWARLTQDGNVTGHTLEFGGTTIFNGGAVPAVGGTSLFSIKFKVFRTGAATQTAFISYLRSDGAGTNYVIVETSAPAETMANPITIKLTATTTGINKYLFAGIEIRLN